MKYSFLVLILHLSVALVMVGQPRIDRKLRDSNNRAFYLENDILKEGRHFDGFYMENLPSTTDFANKIRVRRQGVSHAQQDSNLVPIGDFEWGQCTGVALRDSFAYIGNGAFFQVLDIADLDSPRVVDSYFTGIVSDVVLQDSFAYVLTLSKLFIFDISNPLPLLEVSQTSLNTCCTGNIVVEGPFAYFTSAYNGLHVVDISDPAHPFLRGGMPLADHFAGMVVKNKIVYVGYQVYSGLDQIDATNPDSLKLSGVGTAGFTQTVKIKDTLLFAGGMFDGGGRSFFEVFSISNQFAPVELSLDTIGDFSAMPRSMSIDSNTAYVSTLDSGLYAMDISDPRQISVRSHVRRPYSKIGHGGVSSQNNIIAIANYWGLWLVKLISVDSLQSVSYFIAGGQANDVAVSGNYAIVAQAGSGLAFIDVSKPSYPKRVSAVEIPRRLPDLLAGGAGQVTVHGNYAYASNGSFIEVVDFSDVSHPLVVGYVPAQSPHSMVIQGNSAYVVENDTEVTIYDLSNPQVPQQLGSYAFPQGVEPAYIAVEDSIVACATLSNGLHILNVANPAVPFEEAVIPGFAAGVTLKNGLAYTILPHDSTDFSVYSLNNPQSPILIGSVKLGLYSYSSLPMDTSANFVYVQTNAVDVSNPTSPVLTASYDADVFGITARGSYLYYCNDLGLHILKNDLITSIVSKGDFVNKDFHLLPNYPNPFNSSTKITYSLLNSSFVSLKIYDMLGKLVTILTDKFQIQGTYTVIWTASGASSGIYYYELETQHEILVRKMVLVK